MKTIKDLTKTQAIEIAKMIWQFDDMIKSELEFSYFDGNYGDFTKVDDEEITIKFDFETNFDKQTNSMKEKRIGKMFVHIFPNLDCSIGEFVFVEYEKHHQNGKNKGYWKHDNSYPIRNQNAVQKKFIEWGIEPQYFGGNKYVVANCNVDLVTQKSKQYVHIDWNEIRENCIDGIAPAYNVKAVLDWFENTYPTLGHASI